MPSQALWPVEHSLVCRSVAVTVFIVRSLMVCSRLQKCSAIPDLSNFLLIMSRLCESPFQSSACLSDVLAVLVSVVKQRLHCNA